MVRLLFLLPALAAASPALEARVCGDNCARAVIASAVTTRHGSADCASYLRTTVTPAISTITQTSTVTLPAIATVSITHTEITTTTAPLVVTITTPGYSYTTVTTTTTVTSNWPKSEVTVKKRDQTSAPSIIPAYASACSGAARYTTACACVGVFPTTVTVAAPLATTTAYVSISVTSTVTQIVAVETETATATSTSTTLVPAATFTETATATATLPAFRLRVTGGDFNNYNVYSDQYSVLRIGPTTSSTLWTLNTTTNELIDTRTGYSLWVYAGTDPVVAAPAVISAEDAASADLETATCWVQASGDTMALRCEQPNNPSADLWIAGPSQNGGDESLFLASASDAGTYSYSTALTLKLVGVNGVAY